MARTISSRSRYTARLELRPFRRRDIDAVLAAIDDSLSELEVWLPWAHPGYGRSEAMRFLRDSGAAWAEGRAFDFAVRPRDDPGHHLGNISVWPTSQRERAGEIGYWIRSDATGKGIATEAAARVTDIAFSELALHRVTLRIAVGNRASERIAEKLGYVHEGLLREEVLVRGTWLDHTLWAMLEDEYQRRREQYREAGWLESQP
ncbi:MAG TPA: GNAT family protein [Acidimicrobiia bacterium]